MQPIKNAFYLMLLLTLLTGLIYPLTMTGLAQLCFPWQANGSLIKAGEQLVGSDLIGQFFTDPHYFWGRPSATLPYPYNASASSGSNLGPMNPLFLATVKERVLQFSGSANIPVDLVTASGSGLDPDISPLAAYFQVPRIAEERQMPVSLLNQLIDSQIISRDLGVFGEPRINVLKLNKALDLLGGQHGQKSNA